MQPIFESIRIATPEIVLAVGALTSLLIGSFRGDRSAVLLTWLGVAAYGLAGISLADDAASAIAFDGLYIADSFSAFLKIVVYASAAAVSLLALPYFARNGGGARFEYPVLIMLSALGLGMMLSANDLLSLYIGLELSALAAYVLAAFQRNNTRSSEAGLKYFVLGALASGVLLYGVSLVYGFTGTTNFTTLAALVTADKLNVGVVIGLVFILCGLAFKVSAVPFHMWTPDVYEGAPTPVAAFFASAPKVAAMGLLARVTVDAFGGVASQWQQIIVFTAIASMLLGAVAAIGQSNIKRLLAYSSIANVGFALVGLAAGTEAGLTAVLFYMAVYAAMTVGSFIVVLAMQDAEGRQLEQIDSLAGLARTRPGLALALAVFMFSLAGIPPMLGFWPKFAVFNAAIDAHMYVLAVIGVVSSVVGAFYYLRIIKTMYFDEPAGQVAPSSDMVSNGLLVATAIFCSPVGMLAITPLVGWAQTAARALF